MDQQHRKRKPILSIDDILNGNISHSSNKEPDSSVAASCNTIRCPRRDDARNSPPCPLWTPYCQDTSGKYPRNCGCSTWECKASHKERCLSKFSHSYQFHFQRPSLCPISCTSCSSYIGYRTGFGQEYTQRRRVRASFSHEQVLTLQSMFHRHRYLTSDQRIDLASRLGMTEQQVKIWFQNRRYKEKRLDKDELDNCISDRCTPYH